MKKTKSIMLISSAIFAAVLMFSSCGSSKLLQVRLNTLQEELSSLDSQLTSVKSDINRLKDLVAEDEKEIKRLESIRQ